MKFCMSCGEKKRLRYPSYSPTCCSMRCAARSFLIYAEICDWEAAHCNECGKPYSEYHEETCPHAEEGWDKPYSDLEECHGGTHGKEADTCSADG